MLVLQRLLDESVKIRVKKENLESIGDDLVIDVKIVSQRSGSVKLGFEAPREVEIHRDEIFQMINGVVQGS